jgi:predicted  nucleic acid-binding Zn-ribbon protein
VRAPLFAPEFDAVPVQPMTNIGDLIRLQEIDLALDSRRAAVADAEERTGETEQLIAARATVEETRAAARDAESVQKDVELEADGLRAKITPAEEKLYGGTIKNPKELADLQADIDQLKRHLSSLEDRDLEALSAVEAAQTAHKSAEDEHAAIEQAWGAEQAELRERIERVAGEIASYDAQRDEVRAGIEKDLLARYEHIRRAHQGRGMAKLDRNLCLGCRISLPVSTVNKARQGSTIVQCPNCERILYA